MSPEEAENSVKELSKRVEKISQYDDNETNPSLIKETKIENRHKDNETFNNFFDAMKKNKKSKKYKAKIIKYSKL